MVALVARLSLYLPHAHSLKEKRALLRKVIDRVQARLKVHVAEVGAQDTWQRAQLGFAVVGSDAQIIESIADEVVRSIASMVTGEGEVMAIDRELLRYGEEPFDLDRNEAKYGK